ncbi:site-specific integrase [Mesorhizobium sp.]|uniref:tyrosine-type recombinase/integrase n=1 Tax=Mesorhizobium sp. TaxID=1871066 RepID=UPI000FE4861D|nr:site-specific integrase [Mesorhizobium sp.]RWL98946.1 MAG: site-specific integrase [Mesorhizobium sp.]
MARTLNKLNDFAIKATTKPGRLSDGGGLYLLVGPTGGKSWTFMWTRDGRRREMGLGPYGNGNGLVSLATARGKAGKCREVLTAGRDPLAESRTEGEPTFGEAVELFLADRETGWRNEKHRAQWRMTLLGPAEPKGKRQQAGDYCKNLRKLKVSSITTEDVLAALKPNWQTRPETASRLRGRIERVLSFCKVRGWRQGENPALWRGHLDALLPKPRKLVRGHHRAMDYDDVPTFVKRLRGAGGMDAKVLEFTILTATRSGETVGAKWSEVDLDKKLWTVPAERMKASRKHEVPLSPRALEILKELAEVRRDDNPYVFPGQRKGRPVSAASMEMLLRRWKVKDQTTIHGFRSAFRDWAGDRTNFPRELAEAALAHVVGDKAEQAYRRGTALERRRRLMEAWAGFLASGGAKGKVIPLAARRKAGSK